MESDLIFHSEINTLFLWFSGVMSNQSTEKFENLLIV